MTGPDDMPCGAPLCDISRALVKEAVSDIFDRLGMDLSSSADVREFQDNMRFTAKFRGLSEKVGSVVLITIVIAITGGFVSIVWRSLGK